MSRCTFQNDFFIIESFSKEIAWLDFNLKSLEQKVQRKMELTCKPSSSVAYLFNCSRRYSKSIYHIKFYKRFVQKMRNGNWAAVSSGFDSHKHKVHKQQVHNSYEAVYKEPIKCVAIRPFRACRQMLAVLAIMVRDNKKIPFGFQDLVGQYFPSGQVNFSVGEGQ
jgi:hypothetical protein